MGVSERHGGVLGCGLDPMLSGAPLGLLVACQLFHKVGLCGVSIDGGWLQVPEGLNS